MLQSSFTTGPAFAHSAALPEQAAYVKRLKPGHLRVSSHSRPIGSFWLGSHSAMMHGMDMVQLVYMVKAQAGLDLTLSRTADGKEEREAKAKRGSSLK